MATPCSFPLRVGIVGYGLAGRGFHAYLLSHEPRFRLAAVVTRDPDRQAHAVGHYGARAYSSLAELLDAGDLDLVIVATPHAVHADQAVAVLDAGLHCVVDKVMCLTEHEADGMLAARDRAGRLLTVFHNRRWDGDFMTLRSVLEAGLLGAPRLIEIGIWRQGRPRGWRSRSEELGSIMHDWGAHFVDQLLQLVSAPVVEVRARAQFDWGDLDVESYVGAEFAFQNGVLARLELSNRARLGKPHWFIVGEKGALVKEGLDPQEAAMLRGDIDSAAEDPALAARVSTELNGIPAEIRVPTLPGSWKSFYRNLADALVDGRDLAVKPEEARRVVRLLAAVQDSARTGAPVVFPAAGGV